MSSPTTTKPIAQAFFSNLIDYAGLFPPAALSLEETVQNYFHYRLSNRAWILGRLILQASHLTEIASLLHQDQPEPLSPEPTSLALVTKNPRVDFESAAASLLTLKGQVNLKSIEVGLDSIRPLEDQLSEIQLSLETFETALGRPSLFLELPSDENFPSSLTVLLRQIKQTPMRGASMVGFKLRCGGLPKGAPSVVSVAKALSECAIQEIPLKFTAGLHHPFPLTSGNATTQDAAHGFFNVFFAAFVANAFGASEEAIVSILSASRHSSPAPQVSDDVVSWFGFSLSASTIAELRAKRVLSFGSCSFTEPTDDAVKLGWLPV